MWRDICLANREALHRTSCDATGELARVARRSSAATEPLAAIFERRASRAPRVARTREPWRSSHARRLEAAPPVNTSISPRYARVRGTVRLPGSKSISNRMLLLAALARGDTVIRGRARVRRHAVTCSTLSHARASRGEPLARPARQRARRRRRFPVKQAELFLGNAGTAFRPLTAVLALPAATTGSAACRGCTSGRSATWWTRCAGIGADIDYLGQGGLSAACRFARARSAWLARCSVRGDVSSQFLSALLMALPLRWARRLRSR